MKKLKINIPMFFIVLILLLNNKFFYLIKGVNENITLVIVIMFILYSLIITTNEKKRKKSRYWFNVASIVILIITSSYAALKSYNQPFLLGVRPQRMQLVYYFTYFAFYRLISYNKVELKSIKKSIYVIGILEIVIFGTNAIDGRTS